MLCDTVREAVTALQAAEFYGMEIDRHGKALCIWHEDRHPSLSFKDGFCKCFSCGSGGSSIDLTARLFNLTPIEAARKLQADFGIGTGDRGGAAMKGIHRGEARREAEAWRRKRWAFLCDVERDAHEELRKYPAADATWENPRFRAILDALCRAQTELEQLHIADVEDLKILCVEDWNRGRSA